MVRLEGSLGMYGCWCSDVSTFAWAHQAKPANPHSRDASTHTPASHSVSDSATPPTDGAHTC